MKKLMKVLPVVMVICMVFVGVFAVPSDIGDLTQGQEPNENVAKIAGNVWATIVRVVQILAVAAVVFAGLRYMFASADQKADIKKSMGILAIGALLVFTATTILSLVGNIGNNVLTK